MATSIGKTKRPSGTGNYKDDSGLLATPDTFIENEATLLEFPFDGIKDCLVLTAGALWALFDHTLNPIGKCRCTLQSSSGEFLSCERKIGEWFVWHLETDKTKICGGAKCDEKIALTPDNISSNIHITTPCVLGWPAETRTRPDDALATSYPLSGTFQKNTVKSFELKSIQVQSQLGILGGVASMGVAGAVSFNVKRYKQSTDSGDSSSLLVAKVVHSVVFVYCEARKVHLALRGADLVELMCCQTLNELEYDINNFPRFAHATALDRIPTWEGSTFQTRNGSLILGALMVKDAALKLDSLLAKSKEYKKSPVYWSLEYILTGKLGSGLKPPMDFQNASWYKLWEKYPTLIVAVGEISRRFIATEDHVAQIWDVVPALHGWLQRQRRCPPYGGVLTHNAVMNALLTKSCQIYKSSTKVADSTALEGLGIVHQRQACHTIQSTMPNAQQRAELTVGCLECQNGTHNCCVHYFL